MVPQSCLMLLCPSQPLGPLGTEMCPRPKCDNADKVVDDNLKCDNGCTVDQKRRFFGKCAPRACAPSDSYLLYAHPTCSCVCSLSATRENLKGGAKTAVEGNDQPTVARLTEELRQSFVFCCQHADTIDACLPLQSQQVAYRWHNPETSRQSFPDFTFLRMALS